MAKPDATPPVPPISLFADSLAGAGGAQGDTSPLRALWKGDPLRNGGHGGFRVHPDTDHRTGDRDVYHLGKLVIPAGTELHGTAQTDRARERIASGSAWTLVWQTGKNSDSGESPWTENSTAIRKGGGSPMEAPASAGVCSRPTIWPRSNSSLRRSERGGECPHRATTDHFRQP